jgi:hypothetical protein
MINWYVSIKIISLRGNNYSDLILSDRFFHANSIKIKGIVITVVAISTGCIIPISTGAPIAIKYGKG